MIMQIYSQINDGEGDFVLSDDSGKIISIDKFAGIYIDMFNLDFSNKRILNAVFSKMKEDAYNEDNYIRTIETIGFIKVYLEDLVTNIDYPLEISNDFDLYGLFKLAGIKVSTHSDSHLERLFDFLMLVREVLKTELFIFVNLKSFYSEDEMHEIYSFIVKKEFRILLFESVDRVQKYDEEKTYIIDADLCHIYQ